MNNLSKRFSRGASALPHIDTVLFVAALLLSVMGLVTMNSFGIETFQTSFFGRQVVWLAVSLIIFFGASFIDWRFLRRTGIILTLFIVSVVLLLGLFLLGTVTLGAVNRFDLGFFFFQPSDVVKVVLILLLAKYFSRRHVEIAHIRHIIVSGVYALILFVLVFLQPDFGGSIILFLIWLGMVLVSGISKKHLGVVFFVGLLAFGGLWGLVFQDYQKARIKTFINPLTDIQGTGYNAYQSTITVGSGEILGKGIGFGTQSRLQFLPEYETDFIFAAFAEEWGFMGVLLLLLCFGIVVWRVIREASHGASNFEVLFAYGVAIMLMAHFTVHVGMNIGLLPVTGTVLPFVSYGGSHLVVEFLALGMVMGMRRYRRTTHPDEYKKQLHGVTPETH